MEKSTKTGLIIFAIITVVLIGIIVLLNNIEDNEEQQNKGYTLEELSQYITKKITITEENWKDYIIAEDKINSNEYKNAFGELIEATEIRKETELKIKDNMCGYIVLECKLTDDLVENPNYNESKITIFKGGERPSRPFYMIKIRKTTDEVTNITTYDNTFTTDDIECIRVTGYLYTIDIPEELWKEDCEGKQCIYIKDGDNTYVINKNGDYDNYIIYLSKKEYEKYEKEINN